MNLIDTSIQSRGFTRESVAISIRTAGVCPGMRQHGRNRLLIGIGLVFVDLAGLSYRFSASGRCLTDGEAESDLLDWLQDQLIGEDRPIISFDNFGSVPARLARLADPIRHAALIDITRTTHTRWRDQPRGHTWHLRQVPAQALPCLCPAGVQTADCTSTPLTRLLPAPEVTAALLIEDAVAGWRCWAQSFCDMFDDQNLAAHALRDLDRWSRS
jgi:hypothetical protein